MTHPTTDAARMQRRINEVALVKVLQRVLGLKSDSQIYRWARDPGDHDPDSTGEDGPLARLLIFCAVLGIRGQAGHAVLEELRQFVNTAIDEAKGDGLPKSPVTLTDMTDLVREFSEFADACNDSERVQKEGGELVAKVKEIMARHSRPVRPVA